MADIKFSEFPSGGNCKVSDIVVGLRDADNAKFTFPGTGILDENSNFLIEYASSGAGNINHIFIDNAASTFAPGLSVKGTDTNIDLQIDSKGIAGKVWINDVTFDFDKNISEIASASFSGSSSGAAILQAQAVAGTPTLELPSTSGVLALASAIPAFPLSLSNGGTGASLVANNGGIFYSDAAAGAILAGTATASQVLLSGSASAPSWSTATYPSSTTANQLLYSVSSDVISGLATANSASLVTDSSGVPVWSNSMQDGEVIIGSTMGTPQSASISAGPGISITPGPNSLMIGSTTTGGGLAWFVIVGTTQAALVDSGYIPSDVALTTITLPSVAVAGSMISVQGEGSGGWLIQAPGAQVIRVGSSASTPGGSVASANRYDAITLVCIVASSEWAMYGPVSSGFVIT
jgi:hypothetical protein